MLSLQGLEHLDELEVLDISNNGVENLDGIENMHCLTDLWANDNKIDDLRSLISALLLHKETLKTLYISNNPVVKQTQDFKHELRTILPDLEQIDTDLADS